MDNCGYYCFNFILFLENYVKCKEIISYFSLKREGVGGGGVCNKMWRRKIHKMEGGGSSLLMAMGRKKILKIGVYVHLFLENSSHYFFRDVFVITWTITYSKKRRSLKTSAVLFWVILGFILMVFLYLLRTVKPCLKKVCKDVSCITPMLTALIFFSR